MSYIGVPPFGQTVRTITELTASAGQTTFNVSGGYLPGYVDVFLNGVSLASGDFTSTNGSTVVLGAAASLNDEFKAIAYWPVSLIDTYRKSEADALLATKQAASPTLTTYASTGIGFRNRIINGDMRIDQRNAGASVTPTSSTYTLDRWRFGCSQASKVSVQQSTSAPAGFTNSAQLTVGAAANVTVGASDEFWFQQRIEGFNVADMAFGTASAVTFTVSFWVNSSVTGTYAASFQNNATNYSYVSTFTISAANTWEYKTLTIPAPTAGTWTTDNTVGLYLAIDLGSGSSMNTTAGSWQSGYFRRTSGCVSWVTTNSATFRLTGVQLEAGSVASPFERRDYGRELMMCQRYYYKVKPDATARLLSMTAQCYATTGFICYNQFPVTMRTRPTSLEQSGTASDYGVFNAGTSALTCNSVIAYNTNTTDSFGMSEGTVASGLVAGNATAVSTKTTSAYLAWSAEL